MVNASPQTENGFTRIANELLDAIIQHSFTKRQYKVLLYVMRKTYGFHKKSDAISNGELAKATNLTRRDVIKTLAELSYLNVLQIEKSGLRKHGGEINRIGVNKDYRAWITSGKTNTSGNLTNGTVPLELVAKNAKTSGTVPPTKETKERKKRRRVLPSGLQEVIQYFEDNGYSSDAARRFYGYYDASDWHDRDNKPVNNWKQKAQAVWFRDENRSDTGDFERNAI